MIEISPIKFNERGKEKSEERNKSHQIVTTGIQLIYLK
jgi:hypothetical protein